MNKEILNIVNRILSEEITGKVKTLKNKIFENNNMKKQECSECGGNMYEGECMECGSMYEGEVMEKLHGKQRNIDKNRNNRIDAEDFKMLRGKNTEMSEEDKYSKMCESCGGNMVEGECMECGSMYEGDIQELGGMNDGHPRFGKKRLPKIMSPEDIENLLRGDEEEGYDFPTKPGFVDKRMKQMSHHTNRKHNDVEIDERLYGNQKRIDKNNNNKIDSEDFKLLRRGKKSNNNESVVSMYELHLDKSTGEKFIFNENDIINIIENVVLEEKKKSNKGAKNITKTAQSKSKSENDKYVSGVVKKMKEYLKDGSKGTFEMNPKHFPKGNGDLKKMDKMAYVASDAAKEYVENFTGAALENVQYDEIHPNEEWVEDNIVGSSRTGNNPKWANAVETEVGERRNNIRKNNLLAVAKRKAYQKDDQPVKIDRSGSEGGDIADKLLNKFSSKKTKNESIEDKKVITEIEKMKNLIGYIEKTQ